MGGFRSGFRFSRPRSPRSWVGSVLCRRTRGIIRSPERPIRPHRGPHGPNGWIPDRMRLPGAGTQATPCVRRGTRVRLCADGTSGGPWLSVSNSSGDQRSRFTEMVLSGCRLRLPVNIVSLRRSRKNRLRRKGKGWWHVFSEDSCCLKLIPHIIRGRCAAPASGTSVGGLPPG